MIKNLISIVILFISSLLTVQAQEKIYDLAPYAYPGFGAVLYNNQVYVGVELEPEDYNGDSIISKILILDQEGNYSDEIVIDNNLTDGYYKTIRYMAKIDSTLYISYLSNKLALDNVSSVIKTIDTNNQLHTVLDIPYQGTNFWPETIIKKNDTLILGGASSIGYVFSAIKIYKGNTLIKEHYFPTISTMMAFSSVFFANKYVFGHYLSDDTYLTIMNENLEIDTIFSRVFGGAGYSGFKKDIYDFIVSKDEKHLYAICSYHGRSIGLIKFDTNLDTVRVDEFFTGGYKFNPTYSKFFDYQTPDSIFIAGAQEETENYYFVRDFDTTAHNELFVYCIDTAGNKHWEITIDNHAFYFPQQVVATDDGGALIFSSKYDTAYKKEPHYLMSVIKIDNKGNYISEKEYPLQQSKLLSLYPNPAQNTLNIKLPTQRSMLSYRIYNTAGATIQEAKVSAKTTSIDIAKLNKGFYFIEIIDDKGEVYTSRFQKE